MHSVERTKLFEKRISKTENLKLQSTVMCKAATTVLVEAGTELVTVLKPLGETMSQSHEEVRI